MNPQLKNLLTDWLPPALLRCATGLFYGWKGNYPTWEAAMKKSKGYDSPEILEKVKAAALKVKNGEAAYERDSVIFHQPDYAFPLLASLLQIALEKSRLQVLDYGGSLGSLYFQHKKFFTSLNSFQWHVVEQPHFSETGKKLFEDDHLRFFTSVQDSLSTGLPQVALFGSSLQYLEHPFTVIEEIIRSGIPYLLIDRTPVMMDKPARITVQQVHPSIYKASYPCRLMNRDELMAFLDKQYELIYEWQHSDRINIRHAAFCGFFLKRK